MTSSRILQLRYKCQSLEQSLSKHRALLSNLEERDVRRKQRMHFALGSAIEIALDVIWWDVQTEWFLQRVAETERALAAFPDADPDPGVTDDVICSRRTLWGRVAYELMTSGRMFPSDLKHIVLRHLSPPLRGLALQAMAESEEEAYDIQEFTGVAAPRFSEFATLLDKER